jgi:3-oxoacyl-[acyl-carrier protein] reductase
MTGRLDGRIAVLTGAAVGIGKGIAARLVAEGAQLFIGDRDAEAGVATARSLGLEADRFLAVDVSVERDVMALAATAMERFGRIDIMVQNAGIYPHALISDMTVELWDQILAVNLRSAFLATKATAPAMKAQGGGRMIFTSSITGPRVVSHGLAAYAATKAGINGFIKVAALELAASGITVNAVEPGNIRTEGLEAGRSAQFIKSMEHSIPLGRLGTPADIAGAVAFLASDDAAYITGTTIVVDGGQTLPESRDFQDPASWW